MLENALDYGIAEAEFWEMTLAELHRAVDSKRRVIKMENQERATYDYILANLIINGVGKMLDGKGEFPTIEEAYPKLFDDIQEEKAAKIQEQKNNLSALRFKQFAQSYNSKFKGVASDK